MMRIAFDLDETLGIPKIDTTEIIGFHLRAGSVELLSRLQTHCTLIVWSVSHRRYLNKVLSYGLATYFQESYSWDELPVKWKDVRRIQADYLIDDSPHHREEAKRYRLEDQYIVVPAYGDGEDQTDARLWVRRIEEALFSPSGEWKGTGTK